MLIDSNIIIYAAKPEHDAINVLETALLSEPALAEDWNRPEEDEAWSHLQQVPLS